MAQDLHQIAKRFGIKDIDTVKLEPGMMQRFFQDNEKRSRKRFRSTLPPIERRSLQHTTTSTARSDLTQITATVDDPINVCSDDEKEEDSDEEYTTPPTSPLLMDFDEESMKKKYEFYKFLHESMFESKTNQQLQAVGASLATINMNPHKSSSILHKTSSSLNIVSERPYEASSSSLIASTTPYRISRSSHKASISSHEDSRGSYRDSRSSYKDSRSSYKDSKNPHKISTRLHKNSNKLYKASSSSYKSSNSSIPKETKTKEYVPQNQQLRWNKPDQLALSHETLSHKRHRSSSYSSKDIEHNKKSRSEKKVDYMVISDDEDVEGTSSGVNNDNTSGLDNKNDEIDEIDNDDDVTGDPNTNPFAVTSSKEIQSFFKHPVAQQSNNNSVISKINEKKSTLYYKPIEKMLGVHINNDPSTDKHKGLSTAPLCPKESLGGVCFDPCCSYSHFGDFKS